MGYFAFRARRLVANDVRNQERYNRRSDEGDQDHPYIQLLDVWAKQDSSQWNNS